MAKSIYETLKFTTKASLSVKIAIVGDGAVGKTSIRRAYIGDNFRSEYLLTIGQILPLKLSKLAEIIN